MLRRGITTFCEMQQQDDTVMLFTDVCAKKTTGFRHRKIYCLKYVRARNSCIQ